MLCDPWFNPAYFGSWFPFPRNDGLDPAPFSHPDYLYISHLHHDHFDPEWLAAHVDTSATVLLPAFELDHLEQALRGLGFTEFVAHRARRSRCSSGALEVAILAMTAPADGPAGDSALILARLDRAAPQPERRPAPRPPRARGARSVRRALHPVLRARSGTRWSTTSRPRRSARSGSGSGPTRWSARCTTSADVRAPHVFPVAGPPCFLDDDLFAFNDLDDDPANIFPDQTGVPRASSKRAGITGGELLVPGTVATIADGACTVEQPVGRRAPDAIFGDKRAHLERYRDDWARLARRASGRRGRASRSTSSPRCASGGSRCSTSRR